MMKLNKKREYVWYSKDRILKIATSHLRLEYRRDSWLIYFIDVQRNEKDYTINKRLT